ncbi:Bardet-Biedl syndrome 1 protein homolog [Diachasma alloeum]|uniref:Bardet-Biedl syndrome 1 protein homolog n=1 Tax=Diachasma alloeum TaxID=454923 RepID=UPI0007381BFC|nr:Bardet-Biedl syndrome 1 protein homolog [Diachasma alloeum]
MERPVGSRLSTNRWLDAVWEPSANMHVLPGGLDMLDVSGDNEARLIVTDLGSEATDSAKIRVYKGADQVTEHNMIEPPCGVVGFYSENAEPRSTAVAVGAGSSVYIYKNMRPHFKYCLPYLDAHPKEREIWHRAGLDLDLNVLSLRDDLELLFKELGAAFISPRTIKFLSMDENLRVEFAEQYRRLPLIRMNAVSTIGLIRKDSWNEPASSCIIVGTESGEILILHPRSFSLVDKHHIGWAPVAVTSTGLWSGDGRIFVISRDGRIGAVRKGWDTINLWEKLPAPAVAISTLTCDGAAVALMDGTLCGFSGNGVKLWRIQLPGLVLDLTSLPVPQTGLSLLAISVPRSGVLIYDGQHHVDTINMMEPVSAMKYGRMGQEERAMAMVTIPGGLAVKILKRTANFSARPGTSHSITELGQSTFAIPKKTRLFVEQTIRERAEAKKIHNTFQQGFLRLRLTVAKKAQQELNSGKEPSINPITMEASVLGLGPTYVLRTIVTNLSEEPSEPSLFLVFRGVETIIKPRVVELPLLPSGIPIPVVVKATPTSAVAEKVQILLCKKGKIKPIASASLLLPLAEPDIEV